MLETFLSAIEICNTYLLCTSGFTYIFHRLLGLTKFEKRTHEKDKHVQNQHCDTLKIVWHHCSFLDMKLIDAAAGLTL